MCAAASRSAGEKFREKWAGRAPLEGASELRARADVELAEDAAEVSLDRVLGQEEGLRDLAVGHPLGGHSCDAQLGGGEGAAAFGRVSARARTGGDELVVGAYCNGVGAAGTGQLERLSERLARFGAPTGAADRRAQLEQRERVLEPRRRSLELGDGLLEQLDPRLSRFDEAERAQRSAERTWCPEGPAALELLTRQRTGLVVAVERCQQRRGVGAPGAKRGRMDFPLFLEPAAVEQILERVLRMLKGRS